MRSKLMAEVAVAMLMAAGCAGNSDAGDAESTTFLPNGNPQAGGPATDGTVGMDGTAGTAGAVMDGTTGTAGMGADTVPWPPNELPDGGMGMNPTGAGGTTGGMGPAGLPSSDPIIPEVTAACPTFTDSTITFMGVPGVQMVAGSKRSEATAPMVFFWHGTGGGSDGFGAFRAVRDGVIEEGGVLVSFMGSAGPDFLSGTFVFGAADFPLVDQLVACAVRDHNIDPRQIYTLGNSAGGLFASALAAARSSYIAAVVPDSGGWINPVEFENDATPALMTIHGAPGVDWVVVDFSITSATADKAFADRGGFVIDCDHGLEHCQAPYLDPPLVPDIWRFFKAHPFGATSPWTGGLPNDFHETCTLY